MTAKQKGNIIYAYTIFIQGEAKMIKVTSALNMRNSDAHTIKTKTSSRELMARAGKAVFDSVRWKPPVAIVCGAGNNAGDGFVIASLLKKAGIECKLFLLSDKFSEDGRHFYENCLKDGVKAVHGIDSLYFDGYSTVVDCIFGTGFSGEVREPYRTAILRINQSGAYVVSVDINSGLNADSGLGDICVRSDFTVSLGDFKSGLFLNSAKDVVGSAVNCDIGIDLLEEPAYLIERSDIRHLFENRPHNSNKGDYGYVAVIGGSREYSGAAKLANLSMSALRSGAGVAKLAVPDSVADGVMPYLLESTLLPLDSQNGKYVFRKETADRLIANTAAISVGMGMGRSDEVKKLISYLLASYRGRLIIDADGLNALSELDPFALKNAVGQVILTPHPKEFERLSGIAVRDILSDPITTAREYAATHGVILLLKGPGTVITDGSTVYITDRGCSGMATAGSGDVLSGILTGICGYAPKSDLLLAVASGAYTAGLSGEIACKEIPEVSMVAGDTVRAIPTAIKEILA